MSGPREQTTEPRDQIAEVLVRHPLIASHDERALDLCGGCVWAGRGRVEHAGHVAAAVLEQLRLTEEHRLARYTGGEWSLAVGFADADDAAEGLLRIYRNFVHESRWVSGWSAVGGEPR